MSRARTLILAALCTLLAGVVPAYARPVRPPIAWIHELDAIIGDRPFSVSVGDAGEMWYGHLAGIPRAPASNQKLLLSMVVLDRFAATSRITTEVRTHG